MEKANHIRPASEKNPLLFWLWNNMGVVVCVIAFVPLIIIILANKTIDKKTKVIAAVVAVIALLIGGVASYDFNPVSAEQQQAAIEAIQTDVYWTPFGHGVPHQRGLPGAEPLRSSSPTAPWRGYCGKPHAPLRLLRQARRQLPRRHRRCRRPPPRRKRRKPRRPAA
jgi:hypothetical protein